MLVSNAFLVPSSSDFLQSYLPAMFSKFPARAPAVSNKLSSWYRVLGYQGAATANATTKEACKAAS